MKNLLKPGVIYLGDHGRRICSLCAGVFAQSTGCSEATSAPLEPVSADEAIEWLGQVNQLMTCECGKTKFDENNLATTCDKLPRRWVMFYSTRNRGDGFVFMSSVRKPTKEQIIRTFPDYEFDFDEEGEDWGSVEQIPIEPGLYRPIILKKMKEFFVTYDCEITDSDGFSTYNQINLILEAPNLEDAQKLADSLTGMVNDVYLEFDGKDSANIYNRVRPLAHALDSLRDHARELINKYEQRP